MKPNKIDPEAVRAAIASARARLAEQQAAQAKKAGDHIIVNLVVPDHATALATANLNNMPVQVVHSANGEEAVKGWQWNAEQGSAILLGLQGKTFCLIGAAGTGKTTTLKGLLKEGMLNNKYPPLEISTDNMNAGAPGIALIAYTRRAVRNIAKQMPEDLKPHCMTYHKLMEYAPEFYEVPVLDAYGIETGEMKNKMRFVPSRHAGNPLPRNLKTIVIDEASMLDLDYFTLLWNALPNPYAVQFIILGDLNQLLPIYGQPVLAKMLLENPIVELTQIYRQALESPIIALALALKDDKFKGFNEEVVDGTFTTQIEVKPGEFVSFDPKVHSFDARNVLATGGKWHINRPGRGKVVLHPWKVKWEQDEALKAMKGQIGAWIASGEYLPDEDLILCPWNKSFGTDELNKSIANRLGLMRKAVVHEVIAGFNKMYLAVGDKILVDKHDAIILDITKNPKYLGAKPGPASPDLNRWGVYQKKPSLILESVELTDEQIDDIMAAASSLEERTAEASHCIKVHMVDTDQEETLTKAAELNTTNFAYAITVHKAQGSECRKIFFLTHYCHSAMLMRELVYTAITRAAEELYIVMSPMMLGTAASRPRVKGNTLAAKLAWYQERLKEKME